MIAYSYSDHVIKFPWLTVDQRQRFGVDRDTLQGLTPDGVAGPKTKNGIYVEPRSDCALVAKSLWAAEQRAQEDESRGNNDGVWPALFYGALKDEAFSEQDRAKFASVQQGPWCAAFVSWCIREVLGAGQPQAWGARKLVRRWATAPGAVIKYLASAQPGDLVCWRREVPGEPAAGHVGIVYGVCGDLLFVVEGNGSRKHGAVGVYAYRISLKGRRGADSPQEIVLVGRR